MGEQSNNRKTILVTNDDGVNAPGLQYLVQVLVSTNRYRVLVCAPDGDRSAISHSITWKHPICAKPVEIAGASAYGVSGTPADCASLGVSGELFRDIIPDMVISGINRGNNCGYHVMYSGTVAGAREAFFNGIPSISISYKWLSGLSNVDDFRAAAEVCLPIIDGLMKNLFNGTYPRGCFLNVEVPTDVLRHKGYKVARQSKTSFRNGWKQTTTDSPVEKTYEGADDTDSIIKETPNTTSSSLEGVWFTRTDLGYVNDVDSEDTDKRLLDEGYVAVVPLCGLSNSTKEARSFFCNWVQHLSSLQNISKSGHMLID